MMIIAAAHVTTASAVGLPPPTSVGASIALFTAAILMWQRWAPRVVACLFLVAGASLSVGWFHTGINKGVTTITHLLDRITSSTTGGVVPGMLAILLALIFILEVWPDLGVFRGVHQKLNLHRGGPGGLNPSGRPERLAAAGVGLVLPSVAATIPGTAGTAVLSAVNIIGGLFAWPLVHLFGI